MSKVAAVCGGAPAPASLRRRAARPSERAAMDATDPAGREDRDPGRVRRDHRGRDRGGRPTPAGQRSRQARPGRLAHRAGGCRGEGEQGGLVETDEQSPAVDRDRRRDRPGRPDRRLGGRRDLEVLRIRQAVADQRGFQRHDRPALGQRGRDLRVDRESVGEHRTDRVAAVSRAATPPGASTAGASPPDDRPRPRAGATPAAIARRNGPRTSRPGTRRRRRRPRRWCRPRRRARWPPRTGCLRRRPVPGPSRPSARA